MFLVLFTIFPSDPFNACGVCNDIPFFIPEVFLHLRISLFYLYSWSIFPLDMEFCVNSSFLSAHYNCCASFSWLPWFLLNSLLSFESLFPIGSVSFLWLPSRFFFDFSFQHSNFYVPRFGFLSFFFSIWGFSTFLKL